MHLCLPCLLIQAHLLRSIILNRWIRQVRLTAELPEGEPESWTQLHGQWCQPQLQLLGKPRWESFDHGRPHLLRMADLQRNAIPGWNEGVSAVLRISITFVLKNDVIMRENVFSLFTETWLLEMCWWQKEGRWKYPTLVYLEMFMRKIHMWREARWYILFNMFNFNCSKLDTSYVLEMQFYITICHIVWSQFLGSYSC